MDTICYETSDFVIAYKPHNEPTVPLKGQDIQGTLLGKVYGYFPEVLSVSGRYKWEGGALHRLDTPTSGFVLFARCQEFYDYMQTVQNQYLFRKTYKADVSFCADGCPAFVESYFRHFGEGRKTVRPVFDVKKADSDRLYRTDIRITGDTTVECSITRGFRHQIRSHLSYCGLPIVGDSLYGGLADSFLHLECTGLLFPYLGRTFVYCSSPV